MTGDVIVRVDGTAIRRPADLVTAFDDYQVGDSVTLRLQRDVSNSGNITELKVELEEEVT